MSLQELVLSRRVLLCAETQLYWMCSSLIESEDGLIEGSETETTSVDSIQHLPSLGVYLRRSGIDLQRSKTSIAERCTVWNNTIMDYSARSLTFPTDKFAALAGVTQLFQAFTADEPLVGLWSRHLPVGLLWHVPLTSHGRLDSDAVATLNVPSWSWLKISGQVEMVTRAPTDTTSDLVHLQQTEIVWTGLALTSKISSASIWGRGKIFEILDPQTYKGNPCQCVVQRLCLKSQSGETFAIQPGDLLWYIDECTSQITNHLSCILIATEAKNNSHLDPTTTDVVALVVTSGPNPESGVYFRRAGIAKLFRIPQSFIDGCESTSFILL